MQNNKKTGGGQDKQKAGKQPTRKASQQRASSKGSKGKGMIKKNLNIEIESDNEAHPKLDNQKRIEVEEYHEEQERIEITQDQANWKGKLNLDLAKLNPGNQTTNPANLTAI